MDAASRRILITGATHGLGRALAERFVALGHTVLGCGRSPGPLGELRRRHGAPHDFRAVDVTRDDEVGAWAARVGAEGGAPALLINNAGWIHPNARVWEIPPQDMARVVGVNLHGVVNVLRHFLPLMIAKGSGVVVNMSSTWGRTTSPDVGGYCATKWAIEGLTRSLAQELPSGFAAVALNPGVIHTRMLESCFGSEAAAWPAPEEWAVGAAEYILSLEAEHNGASLEVP